MRNFLYLLLTVCIVTAGYLNKNIITEYLKALSQDSASNSSLSKDGIKKAVTELNQSGSTLEDKKLHDINLTSTYPILKIRDLLVNKNFEKLNTILEQYQTDYEKNVSAENNLYDSYLSAFNFNDSSYEPLLNEWIKSYPKHYQPYLARATYYYWMAWEARGGKWASETSKSQFANMQNHFDKVNADVKQVLAIKQDHIVPFYLLTNIHKAVGEKETVKTLIRLGLEKCPGSFRLRSTSLLAIAPKWGGSYEEMASFAEESQKYLFRNPKFALLKGYMFYEAGLIEFNSKNYNKALELVNKAVSFGDSELFFELRAKLSTKLDKFDEALEDIDAAIAISPQDSDTYELKARILGSMNKFEDSLENITIADLLKPNDTGIRELKEWLAYQYNSKAREFVDKKDFDSAKKELDKAININRVNIDYYKLMDWLLAKQSNWDAIISYWDQYLALKPEDDMAYMERGGAYFHKGDIASAVADAKRAADLGNEDGKKTYERYKGRLPH